MAAKVQKEETSAFRFGYFLSSGFNQKVFPQSQNSIRIFRSPLMTAVFRPLFLTFLTFVTLVSTISVTSILSRDSTCNLRNTDYNHGINSTALAKKTSPCGSFMCWKTSFCIKPSPALTYLSSNQQSLLEFPNQSRYSSVIPAVTISVTIS